MLQKLFLLCLCSSLASAFTVESLPTYGVFYPSLSNQPCLRLKVTAEAGESINSLQFGTGKSSMPSTLTGCKLYKSIVPFFSLKSSVATFKASQVGSCNTANTGGMIFNTPLALDKGVTYLWLCYDISSTAKGAQKVDAELLKATDAKGQDVYPASLSATGSAKPGEIYPFKYHAAAYYRPRWAVSWNKNQLNATHLRNLTEFYHFGYGHSGTEICSLSPLTDAENEEALAKVKGLRGKGACKIVLGVNFDENGNPIASILANEAQRNALAKNLAQKVKEKGFDGVDIDWEYPAYSSTGQATSWQHFAYFLGALREELAGTSASISIAVTQTMSRPPAEVWEQVDYINLMTYGRQGQHSTMQHAKDDLNYCKNAGIPMVKAVLGLPFYSMETAQPRDGSKSQGYSGIVSSFPNLSPATNSYTNPSTGKEQYFNGANLIKEKCKYAIQQKAGGVMVWAYDTDVLLSNTKSLAKAMFSVIKQTKR